MNRKRKLYSAVLISAASFLYCIAGEAGQVVILQGTDESQGDDLQNQSVSDTESVASLCKQSLALMRAQNLTEAFKTIAKAKSEAPASPEVARTYALLYLAQKQPKLAIKAIEDMAKTSKLDTSDFLVLGNARWKNGDIPGARDAYKDAKNLDPTSANAESCYITAMIASNQYSQASLECDTALVRFKEPQMQAALLKLKAQAFRGLQAEKTRDDQLAQPNYTGNLNLPRKGGG